MSLCYFELMENYKILNCNNKNRLLHIWGDSIVLSGQLKFELTQVKLIQGYQENIVNIFKKIIVMV